MTNYRKYAAVFPSTEIVPIEDPWGDYGGNTSYESKPFMKTKFFESEKDIENWLLKNGSKSDLKIYALKELSFGVETKVKIEE